MAATSLPWRSHAAVDVLLVDASSDLQALLDYVLTHDGCRVYTGRPTEGCTSHLMAEIGRADVVVWDVSPVSRLSCAVLAHVQALGAFDTCRLVLTTTHAPMLLRYLPGLCRGRIVLEKPYDLEALRRAVHGPAHRGDPVRV